MLKNKESENNKRIKRKLLPNIKHKLDKFKSYSSAAPQQRRSPRDNKSKLNKLEQYYLRRIPINIERRLVPKMMAFAEEHNIKYNKWSVIPYIF